MKMAKNLVAAMATAALATSMVCAVPAMTASAAPAAQESQSTYSVMAKAKKVSLKVGQTKTFKVNGAKVTKWTTSNKSVATVNKKGKVTAKGVGKATVTAKTKKGSSKFAITVSDPAEQTLKELVDLIVSEGISQPAEDALDDNDYDYVLPLSDDGNVAAVYNYENGEIRFVDASASSYEFRIVMDAEPGDIAVFIFKTGGVEYRAVVSLATYAFDNLEWQASDGTAISEAEQEALSQDIATRFVFNIGDNLNSNFGIQLNDLGFYSLASFK